MLFIVFVYAYLFRYTGIRIELITDPTMFLMVEKGIRGGLSVVSHKYAKANNEFLPDYNPEEALSHCVYLDANNLYGWAMSQKMPYQNLQWLTSDELTDFDYSQVSDDSDRGYILEVDLTYPKHLHDEHSEFPLAPVQRRVMSDEWSPYTKTLAPKNTSCKTQKKKKIALKPHIRFCLLHESTIFSQLGDL